MELTRFQKIMLAVLAGMLLVFGALMACFRSHPGVAFEEGLLKITEQEGRTVYSGRVKGEPVTITVTYPTNFLTTVDFEIGSEIHDACEVLWPVSKLQTELGDTVGSIQITKNGVLLFKGGYDPNRDSALRWYDENGELAPLWGIDIRFSTSGGDPWYGYETTVSQIARFAFGPGTSAHGDPAFFGMAVFLTVLMMVQIVFHKALFRFEHRWARDPEPTEGYLALERAVWVVMAVVIAGFYIAALVKIY